MAPISADEFMRHKVEQFERQRDNGGAFLDWGGTHAIAQTQQPSVTAHPLSV
jgi:hypothetical protein